MKIEKSDIRAVPQVSLDQWRVFHAVVDHGGYARAAEALFKSQSAVSYAMARLQAQLGTQVIRIRGRRAELTQAGEIMLRRSRVLLDQARSLEQAARTLEQGWEAELRLAVEVIFPRDLLMQCLVEFQRQALSTRLDLFESVLSGTEEALLMRQVDLAVSSHVPPGMLGEPLLRVQFLAVASPRHPLNRLGRDLGLADLAGHRQLVIRDSGTRRLRDAGWLGAEQRLTVSRLDTSVEAVCQGLGFAWLPKCCIQTQLDAGRLQALALGEQGVRYAELYLIHTDRDAAGLAAQAMAALLRGAARSYEGRAGQ